MALTSPALLTDATTGTGAPADMTGMVWLTLYLKGTGTISGGTILIEEAEYFGAGAGGVTPNPVWPGAWSLIDTLTASDVTGGAQKAYHLPVGAYASVRARISDPIAGGGLVNLKLIAVGP